MKSLVRSPSSPVRPRLDASRSPSASQSPPTVFPIIGIGASAGGLEAVTQLLQVIPANSGLSFVLIQHLDPLHESILPDLISKVTKMKVLQARDGMPVEINCGYIISPTTDLTLVKGVLVLRPRPEGSGLHLPIDLFFRSLAEDQEERAVGVILSGSGSDGALGLEAIHSQGGMTIVQEPESAKFDGMPRSAVATGCVDLVLPPDGIARELVRMAHAPYVRGSSNATASADGVISETEDLGKILALLRAQKGVDFRGYKRGTIQRRIQRRMLLKKTEDAQEYLAYVMKDPVELDCLNNDLLIQVTRFFRDPAIHLVLKDKIFPQLLRHKAPEEPFRMWVAGCSSGEEVYSLAISLLEYLDVHASKIPIQIFGTDISDAAVEKARAGRYLRNIETDVSAARLRRFFTKSDGSYQIQKSIREMCIFAKQNILKDPPFSKVDLISCRNVLIYIEPALQRKVFSIFHFALNTSGCLVVGTAETPGMNSDLFFPADKKHHVYTKKAGPSKLLIDFAIGPAKEGVGSERNFPKSPTGTVNVQKEADRILLGRYVPAGVIINENVEVLEFRGDTRPYLQIVPGEASHKILRLAREGLAPGLAEALRKGRDAPYHKSGLRLKQNGDIRMVTLDVIPLKVPFTQERHWAVMFTSEPFQETSSSRPAPGRLKKGRQGKNRPKDRWKKELDSTKRYLQAVVEEKESVLEEMQSTNEEALASNEELQSINEELQTAKEELQATNEELTTVNEQLGRSNLESIGQMNDLNNLVDSTRVAIIMVGSDLRIRRFTPFAEKMLHLIPSDIGRLVGDITPRINVTDLEKRILAAMTSGTFQEDNVQDRNGCWYSLRIHPYVTLDKKVDGAVIVLVDVDAMKRGEMAVIEARDYAEDVLATIRELFLVLDGSLRVTRANAAFYRTFQVLPKDVEGKLLVELGNGQWNIPHLTQMLDRAIRDNIAVQDFEVDHEFTTLGRRIMRLNSSVIARQSKGANMLLLAIEDITEKKQAMEQIHHLNMDLEKRVLNRTEELSAANKEMEAFSYSVAHDLRTPLRGVSGFAQVLLQDYAEKLDDQGKDYLQRICAASQHMGQMIDDLLNLSSLTRKKMRSDQVDLSAIAEAVAAELKSSQPERKVHFEIAPGMEATGDKSLLRIALTNLLNNAWKFTSQNPTARIEFGMDQTSPDKIYFIRDNGVGFDMAYVDKIFGVFTRLHADDEFSGTGIGLAIVQRIVRLHGGNIWAKGEVDRGATFYITLAPQEVPRA